MRLDRFLSGAGTATRKEAARAARAGAVTVNGAVMRDVSAHIDPASDHVVFCGAAVVYRKNHYFLLNKPAGYVSATDDRALPCVTELLPEPYRHMGLFPVGRLDRDTVGLMVLTDDGAMAHTLLSPKRHVEKEYRFTLAEPLCAQAQTLFLSGMTLKNGEVCKSAHLCTDPDRMGGTIILTEGKYHQIKRMMGALGNRVVCLERVRFGPLRLPQNLRRGECRELTEEQIQALRDAMK